MPDHVECVCVCVPACVFVATTHTCVCVKLPLLACLYSPCRDTDSPSDKPHLHLQLQLLRLSLFSLISKLPLIPSVLCCTWLLSAWTGPHGNQMLHQPASTYTHCLMYTGATHNQHSEALTFTCMDVCSLIFFHPLFQSKVNPSPYIQHHSTFPLSCLSLFSPLSPSLLSFYQYGQLYPHWTHFFHTITNTDFILWLGPNPIA